MTSMNSVDHADLIKKVRTREPDKKFFFAFHNYVIPNEIVLKENQFRHFSSKFLVHENINFNSHSSAQFVRLSLIFDRLLRMFECLYNLEWLLCFMY